MSGVVNLTSADITLDTDGRDCSLKPHPGLVMGKKGIDYSKNILFNPKHLIIKIIHVNNLFRYGLNQKIMQKT